VEGAVQRKDGSWTSKSPKEFADIFDLLAALKYNNINSINNVDTAEMVVLNQDILL
jgi:hypothetical protein